jgi:glucose/mannose-6-phosphate isomerase
MSSVLDNPEHLKKHDPDDMLAAITRFPQNARKAIKDAEKLDLKSHLEDYNGLVVAGMGGSAVGGLLLKDWLKDTCSVPIEVSRSYRLPTWVNKDTMVYAVSYSGNTEETLSQYMKAVDTGCPIICFSSGGKLGQSAGLHKTPWLKYPKGYQPRAAIAHQFFSVATVTKRLGLIDDETWSEVDEAINTLQGLSTEMSPTTPSASNPGKRLAKSIHGYIPFIYGPEDLATVAYRYSTQFNENSKSPAAHSFFPEAFHNSVMSSEASRELLSRCCAVVIRSPSDASKKAERFTELLAQSYGRVVKVEVTGEGKLSRILSALYIGDFASAYLGILYGHDPGSTKSIEYLKQA